MVGQPASHLRTSARSTRGPSRAVANRNRRRTTKGWRREQSQMERALQRLEQSLDVVIAQAGRQPEGPGMNHERLRLCRGFAGSHQPQAKKMVHARLQRSAGTAKLPAQEFCDVVVEGERGTHIMMLPWKAS